MELVGEKERKIMGPLFRIDASPKLISGPRTTTTTVNFFCRLSRREREGGTGRSNRTRLKIPTLFMFLCVVGLFCVLLTVRVFFGGCYSRCICSLTSALLACVMLELEARQVNSESTSFLCTVPTTREEETTVVVVVARWEEKEDG